MSHVSWGRSHWALVPSFGFGDPQKRGHGGAGGKGLGGRGLSTGAGSKSSEYLPFLTHPENVTYPTAHPPPPLPLGRPSTRHHRGGGGGTTGPDATHPPRYLSKLVGAGSGALAVRPGGGGLGVRATHYYRMHASRGAPPSKGAEQGPNTWCPLQRMHAKKLGAVSAMTPRTAIPQNPGGGWGGSHTRTPPPQCQAHPSEQRGWGGGGGGCVPRDLDLPRPECPSPRVRRHLAAPPAKRLGSDPLSVPPSHWSTDPRLVPPQQHGPPGPRSVRSRPHVGGGEGGWA